MFEFEVAALTRPIESLRGPKLTGNSTVEMVVTAATAPCLDLHGSRHIESYCISHTDSEDKHIAIAIEGSYSDNLLDCSCTTAKQVGAAGDAAGDAAGYIGCIDTLLVIYFKKMGTQSAQNGNKTENRSIGTER